MLPAEPRIASLLGNAQARAKTQLWLCAHFNVQQCEGQRRGLLGLAGYQPRSGASEILCFKEIKRRVVGQDTDVLLCPRVCAYMCVCTQACSRTYTHREQDT